jgi:hypothetical protein
LVSVKQWYPSSSGIREIEALAMSYPRIRAALPAVALTLAAMLAAGCAHSVTSAATGTPSAGQAGTGQASTGQAGTGQAGTPSGSAPGASGAGSPSPVPTITVPGTPVPGKPACANWPSSAPEGPLPVTFVPVEALRCVMGTTTVAGKGVYVSATLERATQDLGILVAALHHPSGHMLPGRMCPMLAMIAPQIVLVASDGAAISPRFPVDDCGLLQQGVISAIARLPWQAVSVRLLSRLPSVNISGTAPGA